MTSEHSIEQPQETTANRRFPSVKWHELWLVRTSFLACLIVIIGYILSLTVAIQGIESITNMAFDPQIDKQMDLHLQMIKKAHKLRQETFVSSLSRVIPQDYLTGRKPITQDLLRQWITQTQIDGYAPLDDIIIQKVPSKEASFQEPISWNDSFTILVLNYTIQLPKDLVRKDYVNAENLILKHRAIKANWTDEIQPTLIALQILIVFGTGGLLFLSILIVFKKFKTNIRIIASGFSQWSEKDSTFRFDGDWTGEVKYIADRFNHMADEVEQNRSRLIYLEKVASWQIIAKKLAHEIKNPLTPIQMMVTQLVRRYKGEDPDFRNLLEDAKTIISEEVSSLRKMVDNFSKFAQLPLPKLEPNDLVEVARQITELEKAAFPNHNIVFQSHLAQAISLADPHLIRQVLINLIKNAAEAAEGNSTRIEISVKEDIRSYTICVHDNGPGIPEHLQARIFEAYFTTKHSGPNPGMGLGLAVCQKVMLEHGGNLRVTSSPGDTNFLLILPKWTRKHTNQGAKQ